ncbi:hypothetical protein GE09DRAFT_6279 [Coniochaeta sp. 2T2.1]|nr:hypothetical protein GE09DRAFT_6279 [Coniochaeta sp. 2T2.1]
MALLGISLIVASAVLFCFQRPQWFMSFLEAWRPRPALGPVPPKSEEEKEAKRTTTEEKQDVRSTTDREAMPLPPLIQSPTSDPETTLKATAAAPNDSVPTFTLSGHDDPRPAPGIPSASAAPLCAMAAPTRPSSNMAPPPRPSGNMAPPPRPPILAPGPARSSNLMQPPSRPATSSLMPPPSRPPTLAPLPGVPRPNPAPSRTRQPGTSTLAPPPSHSSKPTKPSRQVILTPGHSPLDWARLSTSPDVDLRNLPGGPSAPYLRVTPSMLKKMTGRKGKDAWSVLGGKVYNITPYVPFHPGGEAELLRGAGRDGTKLFGEVHPWVNYEGMLAGCLVGILVGEEEREEGGAMEEMD